MIDSRISPHTDWLRLAEPLALDSGQTLPDVRIAYRSWGPVCGRPRTAGPTRHRRQPSR